MNSGAMTNTEFSEMNVLGHNSDDMEDCCLLGKVDPTGSGV